MKVKKAAKKMSPKNGNGKKISAKSNGTKKVILKNNNGNGKKVAAKNGNGNGNGKKNGNSSIKKQYLKTSDFCNVTFRLPMEAAPDAHEITIVGDFNSWDVTSTPMTKLKSGEFKVTMKLPRGKEYKFRYFIDASRWENDWSADDYIANEFGCDDSLVKV